MRKPNESNWGDFPEKPAIVLFAQSLLEALFDHSVDSFKAPALNVHSLALEVRSVSNDVLRERINSGALVPVLEELQERMSSCAVLALRKTGPISAYRKNLSPKASPRQVWTNVKAMLSEMDGKYWDAICQEISVLVRRGNVDRKIVDLAHSFICEAELRGFTREDIYLRANAFFFKPRNKKNAIRSIDAIDDFITTFRTKELEDYDVEFLGEESFFEIKELCEQMNIGIHESDNSSLTDKATKELAKGGMTARVIVSDVRARDVCKARENAEDRLQFAVDIHRYFSHQHSPKWNGLALVTAKKTKKVQRVKPATTSVFKGAGMSNRFIPLEKQSLVSIFAGEVFTPQSVRALYNVLQYHRAAMEATTPENQLLDLWAAIEGFTPSPDKDSARISHYLNQLVPALTLSYPGKIFSYIDSCIRESLPEAISIIDTASDHKEAYQRTAAVLVADDLQEVRDQVVQLCADNPLLFIRMKRAHDQFSSTEKVKKSLERHRKWVGWHLQRIYSSRNRISHSATRLPYLETLVENLHSYLDILVSSVVTIGARSETRIDIESALRILSIHEAGYLEDLNGADRLCQKNECIGIIFGMNNPLNPSGKALFS